MRALITGASSGIGLDMAHYLSSIGYDLVLVSRNIEEIKNKKFDTNVEYESLDLSDMESCYKVYNKYKNKIDILINNAGFGLIGLFNKTDLEKEFNMIDLNVKAYHLLTKLFLKDFIDRDSGYILNVASSAAFEPGPLMATYYATKAYVHSFTLAIYGELKKMNSKVKISCLCPGPVNTNFNKAANCEFTVKSLSSEYVARYAIDKMLKNKLLIIPGFSMRLAYHFGKIAPIKLKLRIVYGIQHRKVHK